MGTVEATSPPPYINYSLWGQCSHYLNAHTCTIIHHYQVCRYILRLLDIKINVLKPCISQYGRHNNNLTCIFVENLLMIHVTKINGKSTTSLAS